MYESNSSNVSNSSNAAVGGTAKSRTEQLTENIKTKLNHLERLLQPVMVSIPSTPSVVSERPNQSAIINSLEEIDSSIAYLLDRIQL